MLTCPMCKKSFASGSRECPSCRADLSLLVGFIDNLQGGVERAAEHTRAGRLGDAVWAYLEVLEVDPDHPAARQQVGQVVMAVRQFDRIAPSRRWLRHLEKEKRHKERWERLRTWLPHLVWLSGVVAAFAGGYLAGRA
jgi:hypothetical protein